MMTLESLKWLVCVEIVRRVTSFDLAKQSRLLRTACSSSVAAEISLH